MKAPHPFLVPDGGGNVVSTAWFSVITIPHKGIKMNKSVLQRGIIFILCSCILFSICPVYAFAAENQKERVVRIGVPDDTYDKINGNG